MEILMKTFESQMGPVSLHSRSSGERLGSFDLTDWTASSLNPKNRIQRASILDSPNWEIFGANLPEQRLFILPKFAIQRHPVRIDVYISSDIDIDDRLCKPLHGGISALIQATASELRRQPLILHLLHALEYWSGNRPGFEGEYMNMPFGSWILVENMASSVANMRIHLMANHDLELQWLSAKTLQKMWHIADKQWPEAVDRGSLQVLSQPHDAVSIVTFSERWGDRKFVFKSTTKKTRYLYHELKMLSKIDPHHNIIERPLYLVTKKCNFGGKIGVCGFLLSFHPTGNLSGVLRPGNPHNLDLNLATRLRFALQLGSALLHIKNSVCRYYSDCKLDNIVLKETDGGYDAVLIDFEQRGAWFSWSPPEINHITVLESYIFSARREGLPESVTSRYAELLQSCLPGWRKRSLSGRYTDDDSEHNPAWSIMTPKEQEKATVFMFGKVLWCLFECQPAINSTSFYGASIFKDLDTEPRFPNFRRTPPRMQQLIKDCTAGAPEWTGEQRWLGMCGNVVFPAETGLDATPQQTQELVRKWWKLKIEEAETYMSERSNGYTETELAKSIHRRPALEVIFETLQQFGQSNGLLSIGSSTISTPAQILAPSTSP